MGEWLIMVKSLVEELQALIQSEANNYPPPQRCSVTHVYDDKHVDVKTKNDVLVYVELLGADVEKGDSCLLVFLNDEYNDYVAISSNGSNSSGGDVDVDVDFTYSFGLSGIDDEITIDAFLKLIGD